MVNGSLRTNRVLELVSDERSRQRIKWGNQDFRENGTGEYYTDRAEWFRHLCDEEEKISGSAKWSSILLEEVYEALAEEDTARLKEELVQVAAVCVAWLESIEKNTNERPHES